MPPHSRERFDVGRGKRRAPPGPHALDVADGARKVSKSLRLLDRQHPAGRLVWFVVGLLLILAAVEAFERRHETFIAAASHRGLTKVAMFARHPRVDVLFLGSSRT